MKVITILLMVLFLGGCTSTDKREAGYSQNNEIVYLSEKGSQLHIASYDAKTKRDSKSERIENKNKQIIDYSLFTLQDGYAVYSEWGKASDKNKNGDSSLSFSESQDVDKRLTFYDKELSYRSELDLTKLFRDVAPPDGKVAIDETGTKLAVTGTKYGFGIYDIKNKKWMDLGQPLKDNQYCCDVAFTKNGQLNCLINEDGMNYSFGMFDISKKSLTLKKIEYIPHPIQNPDELLYHTDDLLYLNEQERPAGANYTPLSGNVIVMDTKTADIKMLAVKGVDSAYSRMSPNGAFMVSLKQEVNKNGHYVGVHINVYDTKTMKIIHEYSVSTDFGIDHIFMNNKGFVITLSKNDDSKVIYYGF